MRDLATLPKAHLHLHLDGAIRERTPRELCEKRGTDMPELPLGKSYASFDVFMDAITACHDVLSSPDLLHRIVFAFPPAPFVDAFAIAKSGGLLAAAHAGELLGPASVADALDLLHADRILHGVRAVEDAGLVSRLASSGAPTRLKANAAAGIGQWLL